MLTRVASADDAGPERADPSRPVVLDPAAAHEHETDDGERRRHDGDHTDGEHHHHPEGDSSNHHPHPPDKSPEHHRHPEDEHHPEEEPEHHHHSEEGAEHHHHSDAEEAAHDDEVVSVVVSDRRRKPRAASSHSVTGAELKLRPRRGTHDVVEAVPGLLSIQHAGGGKASQFFLRGFDADHGTDVAFHLDGIPINMPTHGHGQGWTDLNFIIPELIATLNGYKGPYHAQFGDFATAGAVDFVLANHLDQRRVSFSLGQYGVLRGLMLFSAPVADDTTLLVAGEAYAQDGPFDNAEQLQRINGYARVSHDLSPSATAALTVMAYGSDWNASGQIPLREVEAGRLDRFGSIDSTEGGATQRQSIDLRFSAESEQIDVRALAYLVNYDFRLFSNFTFFLDDEVAGDQIEQTDERTIVGGDIRVKYHEHYGPMRFETTFGLQSRFDVISNGLFRSEARERLSEVNSATAQVGNVGLFLEERAEVFDWLELTPAIRFDRIGASATQQTTDGVQAGSDGELLVSPKLSVVLSPHKVLDLFFNVGRGYHSNDARGAVRADAPASLMVPALGFEVGTRLTPLKGLTFSATAFRLDLDSEQVFVGDAGDTEPKDGSTRAGLELGARLTLDRHFIADADATFTRAEFTGAGGGVVALAPTRTLSSGVGFRTDSGTFGSVRLRHVGERPATEDESITAEGWTLLDALIGHRLGQFELTVEVQNLLNAEWRAVQFATESRLQNEAEPVEEIHFTPGWPFSATATLSAYF